MPKSTKTKGSAGSARGKSGAERATASVVKLPRARVYWAVQHGRYGMPCLFGHQIDAIENKEPYERVVQVRVQVIKEHREWEP